MVTTKKANTKRVRVAIPEEKLVILRKHRWCVFTVDKVTRDALAEYVSAHGVEMSEGKINRDGKDRPVFFVDFQAVEWLRNNRYSVPYHFIAYHRNPKKIYNGWVEWLEGKKGPSQHAKKTFERSDHLMTISKEAK